MSVLIRGNTGEAIVGDGEGQAEARFDRLSGLVVTELRMHFAEMVARGRGFIAVNTAGAAPGVALATTAGAFALWNPPQSRVNLEIIEAEVVYLSGTLGAGVFYYVTHDYAAAAPTGTALVPRPLLLGSTLQPAAKAYSAPTAGLGANPAALRPMAVWAAPAAQPTGPQLGVREVLDGEFVVAPGGTLSFQEIGAAGTTPLIIVAVAWEEVPIT